VQFRCRRVSSPRHSVQTCVSAVQVGAKIAVQSVQPKAGIVETTTKWRCNRCNLTCGATTAVQLVQSVQNRHRCVLLRCNFGAKTAVQLGAIGAKTSADVSVQLPPPIRGECCTDLHRRCTNTSTVRKDLGMIEWNGRFGLWCNRCYHVC
jgi:hypothetical protein